MIQNEDQLRILLAHLSIRVIQISRIENFPHLKTPVDCQTENV